MTEKDNKLIKPTKNKKDEQLEQFRVDDKGKNLTTNQGLMIKGKI